MFPFLKQVCQRHPPDQIICYQTFRTNFIIKIINTVRHKYKRSNTQNEGTKGIYCTLLSSLKVPYVLCLVLLF